MAMCVCGGSRSQHTGDDGCWCRACLKIPLEPDRCQQFVAAQRVAKPKAEIDRNVLIVGREHPVTSHDMARAAHPASGTLRRAVFDVIVQMDGATDDEIEQALGRSHQSVSGSRNSLMNDRLIEDSGRRKTTRYGYEAIVWQEARVDGPDNVLPFERPMTDPRDAIGNS